MASASRLSSVNSCFSETAECIKTKLLFLASGHVLKYGMALWNFNMGPSDFRRKFSLKSLIIWKGTGRQNFKYVHRKGGWELLTDSLIELCVHWKIPREWNSLETADRRVKRSDKYFGLGVSVVICVGYFSWLIVWVQFGVIRYMLPNFQRLCLHLEYLKRGCSSNFYGKYGNRKGGGGVESITFLTICQFFK